jgi:hypothetical protein
MTSVSIPVFDKKNHTVSQTTTAVADERMNKPMKKKYIPISRRGRRERIMSKKPL